MDQQQDLRIGTHLKTLWKGKWLILLTTVIALGGVLAFADSEPERSFRAVATIKVDPVVTPGGVDFAAQLSPADRSLNTYVLLLQSRNVMDRALRKVQPPSEEPESPLDIARQVEELRGAISVRAIPNANLLEVTARGQTPQEAEGRANAVIVSFMDYVKEERTLAIEVAVHALDAQIRSSETRDDIGDLLSILIPDLDSELQGIIRSVDQSIRTLDQLQPQGDSGDPRQVLSAEIPRLEKAAASLDNLSRGLQSVQVSLEEGRRPTTTLGGPALQQEAVLVKGIITDLELLHRDLQAIRSQVNQSPPAQRYEDLAVKAENARESLRQASQQLEHVRTDSIEQARRMHSVKLYIDSVAADLQGMTATMRGTSTSNAEQLERDRAALQGKVLAHSSGLTTASDDLRQMRNNLELSEYAKIIASRGHLDSANNQLRQLNTGLDATGSGGSLSESITEIMNWTQGARLDLQAANNNYLVPEVVSGTQAEREAAIRAGNDIGTVSLTLEVSSFRARNLTPMVSDPLLQVRLNSAAARLTAIQRSTAESSTRLKAIGQVGDAALAIQLGAVRDRVQSSAEDLHLLAEGLGGSGSASIVAANANMGEVGGIYTDPSTIAWSLDVASRQLQSVLQGRNDPLLQGEVGSLQQQLIAAHREVQAVSDRWVSINGGGAGIYSQLAIIENKLTIANSSLAAAARVYGDDTYGATAEDLVKIKEAIDIAAAILGRVSDDLVNLQGTEVDSYRFGQLVVLVGRTRDVQQRTSDLSSHLQSLQGNATPEVREMRQLKRQLELSLLQPQEIGITQVDSAVSPQASRESFFSQAMLPLAGVAGMLLGSLGVLMKAQVDPTVRSQNQLRDRLGLTSLGVVPQGRARGNPHPPMVSIGDQPVFSEALQMVGTGLSKSITSGVRSLLITSPGPKEGKTMLAVNLAHVLSRQGHRVLLVDGNLRKPEVAEVLDLPNDEGLATALARQQNPLDNVVETGGYYVLPGGRVPHNPVELLSSPAMGFFLQQAQRNYDVVLVDGPPTLGFAEVKALSQGINASILVIRAGATRVEVAEEAKSELEACGTPVAASVLNFAPDDECHHLHHEKYMAGSKGKKRWPR